jgi:hypothetical protein
MFVIHVGNDGGCINMALNVAASHTILLVVNKESLTSKQEQILLLLRAKMGTSLWYVQYLLVSFLNIIRAIISYFFI